ncbi:O-antigen ligase [Marinobacter nauticus]|uniref:O-antigen ligase n=1 Tax=Marinobacter nauticus TaxID=2743 RepID=A0A368XF05_MARNT|nr:O-antigen ligase family protein [Marinobacter nauticus]RCW66552.1 O-antigen ligase [Marinobacter nauticus]
MNTLQDRTRAPLSVIKSLGAERWLSVLFATWLLLAVTTPEVVYRSFFHALIYPLTLFLLVRRENGVLRRDGFVRLFLVFCGYMAVTTWVVGKGPVEDDLQATRWGFEAALGLAAFSLWVRAVVGHGEFWGRWFLLLALSGALCGILFSWSDAAAGVRIGALGVMEHPIQGASIAIMFLAIGLFLTFGRHRSSSATDLVIALGSLVAVTVFVTLTQSRGPLVALLVYLFFFTALQCFRQGRLVTLCAFVLVIGLVTGLLQWLMGFEAFLEQLMARGASYRLEIWTAYLTYLPESLLLGNGAGMNFDLTDASRLYLEPMGLDISHPHNIWLGVFVETGLIGLLMQVGLVLLPIVATLRSRGPISDKLHRLALVGLFLLLTFSDEYTLLISLHPIWLFGWLPLVFVWTWSTRRGPEHMAGYADRHDQRAHKP